MRAQHGIEERRRQLVMLLVRLVSQQRERGIAHRGDECFAERGGAGDVTRADLSKSLTQQPPDAGAHERVGDAAFLGPFDGQVRHVLLSSVRCRSPSRLYVAPGQTDHPLL